MAASCSGVPQPKDVQLISPMLSECYQGYIAVYDSKNHMILSYE